MFAPIALLQLPITATMTRDPAWRIDTVGAVVLGLVVVGIRGTRPARRLPWSLAILVGAAAVTGALVLTQERAMWWGLGVMWIVAVTGALNASWADAWPGGRRELAVAHGCGALAIASPLLVGWEIGGYMLPLFTLCTVTAIGVGLLIRRQRLTVAEQRADARERERRAMAAELHDVIAHELTGIVVLAQAVADRAGTSGSEDAVGRIEASGQRALGHVRSLVSALGDPREGLAVPPRRGDLSDVAALVDRFRATTGAEVNARVTGRDVPGPVALTAHRVVSEALTNVRRHAASARTVAVDVRIDGGALVMSVDDDGRGGGLGGGAGSGLRGLEHRAALVGGRVCAGPGPDGGWRVRATLPIEGDDR